MVGDDDAYSTLDPRRTNQAFVKFKIAEFSNFYFGMVGVGCGILEYEIAHETEESQKWRQIVLLSIGLFASICLLVSIWVRYQLHMTWLKTRGLLGKYDSLLNTG